MITKEDIYDILNEEQIKEKEELEVRILSDMLGNYGKIMTPEEFKDYIKMK